MSFFCIVLLIWFTECEWLNMVWCKGYSLKFNNNTNTGRRVTIFLQFLPSSERTLLSSALVCHFYRIFLSFSLITWTEHSVIQDPTYFYLTAETINGLLQKKKDVQSSSTVHNDLISWLSVLLKSKQISLLLPVNRPFYLNGTRKILQKSFSRCQVLGAAVTLCLTVNCLSLTLFLVPSSTMFRTHRIKLISTNLPNLADSATLFSWIEGCVFLQDPLMLNLASITSNGFLFSI